jgi:ABC-2 type transport system ATP-binding protein
MENVLIEFSDVTKSFNKKLVLDKINLKIYEGEIFGLVGRSGSGKSTLIKILLGTYKPDSGKVFFRGNDITGNSYYLRKIVGLTTQENSFYDKLTVYENMRYYGNLFKVKKSKDQIMQLLSSVELNQSVNTLAENLSGGMKRRLDFALSMIHDPELLILDEPTTGLDPILVRQFWQIVRNATGKTILVISHIFPEIKHNCKRVCLLGKGKAEVITITPRINLLSEFERATT